MKIRALIGFAAMAMTLVHAQQPQQQEGAKPSKPGAFRFEYTLTELNGKQKINVRKFEIMTGNRGSLKSTSKVAIPVGTFGSGGSGGSTNTQFSYVDLGLKAEMESVAMREGLISLYVEVDETFLVPAESTSSGALSLPPSTRQVIVRTATEVKPGVPTVLGTVEDVASTHSFELSVTATPL